MIIRTYSFNQDFVTPRGRETYSGHIYAFSLAEAKRLCKLFGAVCDGEVVETICEGCGHKEVFNEVGDDILEAGFLNES